MARKIGSRYTAHQILGRGSAGTVWLGEGPEGPVAIKLLREDLASDQELVSRFVQERTALLGLEHPHVVSVRDLVVDGNDLALVMDLVRGTDLRTRLDRERRLAPEAAVAIVADVADGLAAAHAAGVVHRDVKPENVLLDMQGPIGPGGSHPALLTDFGVAKLIDTPGAPAPRRSSALPTTWPRRSSRACRRGPRSTSTPWPRSCTSCSPASRPSAAATPARSCAATSPRPSSPSPASRTSCGSSSCSAWPRRRPPGCAPPSWAPGCASCCRCWPGWRRWTWTSPTRTRRRTSPRRPPPRPRPPAGRSGAGGGAAGAGREAGRLQPRHAHLHARTGPRRAGRRRPRHRPGPARVRRPRPGSARNRAAARRRRLALGAGTVALVAAIGVGTWLATSGDEGGAGPQDTRNSAPASP